MNNEMTNEFLTDDELENVAGGKRKIGKRIVQTNKITVSCCGCNKHFVADISKTHIKCPYCAKINRFDG